MPHHYQHNSVRPYINVPIHTIVMLTVSCAFLYFFFFFVLYVYLRLVHTQRFRSFTFQRTNTDATMIRQAVARRIATELTQRITNLRIEQKVYKNIVRKKSIFEKKNYYSQHIEWSYLQAAFFLLLSLLLLAAAVAFKVEKKNDMKIKTMKIK